ncbi:glycosyl hydrolase family 61-domain-containing protein [Mycena galopus ATCC 62051]|nr:glycosyl hydrolase family 61-domain-containing protein [Mycena galopus ATCC 62051]
MIRLCTIVLLLLLAIQSVSAHGFVWKVGIASQTLTGNIPNAQPTGSITRQINSVDPVKGAANPYLNCGNDAQLASDIADANPGDPMSFLWAGGDLSRWPHNIGPMLTYMTPCPDSDCTTYNSSTAKWFKIAEVGRIPGDAQGTWFQNFLFSADGVPANATLPDNIAPGPYLIRHEIIALHLATTLGGAEFYPSCSQIRVGGSGTGAPTQDELVNLPGAYSDTDPGILVPDVFNVGPVPSYTFPGPPVAAFVTAAAGSGSGSGSGSSPTASVTHSGSPSATAPASSPTSSPGNKTCKLKRATTTTPSKRAEVVRPRHFSRIMRDLAVSFSRTAH